MSEIMRPLPFGVLMRRALHEYARHGSLFGVSQLFRMPEDAEMLPLFHETLETPFGPAAGPHTQLAQNIVAGYAAGARFFELKTVQIMDGEELSKCVPKPCIT
ncbi:MAG: putative selenate reductase subunit YgfK, partial [Eubacteriales bacterium]|nr:putative selenate reductase subunit YgfK [Eubacteriales bacterium]